MPDSKAAVMIVVTLFVAGIITAFLMPVVIGAISDDETATYNQSAGETVELNPGLNATVDTIDTATSPATITYTLEYDGDTTTGTAQVGSNTTLSVSDIDVTVGPTDNTSSTVTTDYDFPTDAGWGAAGSLWIIIPLFLVLPVFMLFVRIATKQM